MTEEVSNLLIQHQSNLPCCEQPREIMCSLTRTRRRDALRSDDYHTKGYPAERAAHCGLINKGLPRDDVLKIAMERSRAFAKKRKAEFKGE
jgi:hypothetical protein